MKYDIAIIGSGPGGYVAAIRASQLGKKVAIIERESLGGICLNWGCIPTKALLKSAQVFNYIKSAGNYGIKVEKSEPDFGAIVKRSRDVAGGMSKGVQFLMKKNKIDVIEGFGKITVPGKVDVHSRTEKMTTVEADHIIIATGGRSKELPNLPIDGKKVIGYREALTLKKVPKRMVVVGAGAIGVEFAYFYATMGSEVTVVEFLSQGLLPREDPDISKELTRSFKKMGINVLANTSVMKVENKAKDQIVSVRSNDNEGVSTISCDIVLSAVGVSSNIEGIGIESLGIRSSKGQIEVDPYYRTNIPGIYAIGDVVPGPALAHVASAEGIICVEKICEKEPQPLNYGNIPSCTYCHPEIASVGYSENAAREAGYDVLVGKFPFSASGKASASGHKSGFVKVIFDAKYGEWLGAHLIGENVTEMIAEVVAARTLETTGHEIIRSVHPHPTMSEAIMEAAAAAYGEVIHI